ncbi:sulfatase [Compostibacter hankyongensis]|uniref:Sulfatase N-terminal domain-containing protein n=1 Tax=Compostibacter hankyongensis TaxID=1007089 RepID=A0ABP8FMM5_9BACT
MRKTVLFLSLLCTVAFTGYRPAHEPDAPPSRPNVVFIVVDDMNMFPVLHNYPGLKTPNMDKLASESYNFLHASCAVPLCAPSRAAFFSGIAPYKTGVYRNFSDIYDSSVLSHAELLPECFQRNGYLTWGGGKTFHMKVNDDRENKMFGNAPVKHGGYGPYAEKAYWYGKTGWASVKPWTGPDTDFPDVRNADNAIAFLQEKHDKPFFLYYGLFRPHTPYTAPKRFYDLYKDEDIPLPSGYKPGDLNDVPPMGRALVDSMKQYFKKGMSKAQVWKALLNGYRANISFADWNVGRVLDALDKSGYAENTIVVFCADNGFHCGTKDHWTKKTLWDEADRVPFMIRLPDKTGAVCYQTVGLIDIFPTLTDYCRLKPPAHTLDGKSLTPILNDPKISWERAGFTTWGVQYSSVLKGPYRYIRYPDGAQELYDHRQDPYEWNNLAADPKMKTVIGQLAGNIPEHFEASIPPAHAKKPHKKRKP